MALSYDLTGIADRETVCSVVDPDSGKRLLSPVTEGIVFATMAVGIGHLTEADADLFTVRLRVFDAAAGIGADTAPPITPEDIRRHIGLRTNVTRETDAAFSKKITRIMREKVDRMRHRREAEAQTDAA